MSEQAAEEEYQIPDIDRDALHILPLFVLPIETPGLRRARLIKNARLESVVEFFRDQQAGSGQMDIEGLPAEFGWPDDSPNADMIMIRNLAALPSYDVYSLRIRLRELGIQVDSVHSLQLSERKRQELSGYMKGFTRPLIMEIYGGSDQSIQNFDDVVALFRDPDVKKAREKLETLAEKLGLTLEEVPKFLEDYGDVFLSLSYYRGCFDLIQPAMADFLRSIEEIRQNPRLAEDRSLMQTCAMMESTFSRLSRVLARRFESFSKATQDMWDNISAQRFRQVENLIKSYHTSIGGILCSLSVKMDAWTRLFPKKDVGGPMRRAEFIMSEMKQGIEKIERIEEQVRRLSAAG